jgi:hypothetical protein
MRTESLALALSLTISSVVAAQQPSKNAEPAITFGPWTRGIQPLTEETYQEAVDCGAGGYWPSCTYESLFCPGNVSVQPSISTPFNGVAATVAVSKARLEKPKLPTLIEANAGGVEVIVNPGEDLRYVRSVERIVIQRAGKMIEATRSRLTSMRLTNAFGAGTTANRGSFAFPVDTFAPGEDLSIAIVTEAMNPIRCILRATDLARIR